MLSLSLCFPRGEGQVANIYISLYSTITVTVYDDDAPSSKRDLIAARQATVTPTAIPQYATACSEAPRYASACSCFGVTGSVTTAPTPTVTVTSTIDYCDDL